MIFLSGMEHKLKLGDFIKKTNIEIFNWTYFLQGELEYYILKKWTVLIIKIEPKIW